MHDYDLPRCNLCGYSMRIHPVFIDIRGKPYPICTTSIGTPRIEEIPRSAEADRS